MVFSFEYNEEVDVDERRVAGNNRRQDAGLAIMSDEQHAAHLVRVYKAECARSELYDAITKEVESHYPYPKARDEINQRFVTQAYHLKLYPHQFADKYD